MSVTHPASHTDTHTPFLAACATSYSSAPPKAAQGPDSGAAVLSARPRLGWRLAAWKPPQLPDPPCQFLLSRAGRGCCPTGPFCATGQGLKSLLQRKLSFSSLHNRTVWLRLCYSKATDYSLGPDWSMISFCIFFKKN